jgi:hypothetical protein
VEKAAADKAARRGGFDGRFFLRATGFNLPTEPPRPGEAKVERLRSGNGLRVPLIPPLLSGERKSVFEFRRLGLDVEIEFREQDVYVRLIDRDQLGSQLSLFNISDEDDSEQR